MKLQMQSIHFDADKKLLDFIKKKSTKLDTYYDRIIDGEVFLRLEKDEHMENKIVEIKINIPGSSLFVKEQGRTFEAATDLAIDGLQRQLKKFKEKKLEKRKVV
jgi:putative sigma-54 modulation protein